MSHAQGPLQIDPRIVHGEKRTYYRVGCTCGRFQGGWQSEPKLAFGLQARHAALAEAR